jgi:maltose/moltooligosaccharide transporter
MITLTAFLIGAAISIGSIGWSLYTTREIPLTAQEIADIKRKPVGVIATLNEIWQALRDMPTTMRQLVVVKFFQWYALFCYWQYIVSCLARSMFDTVDAKAPGFREADLLNGQIGAFYNFIAFAAAFALIPVVKKLGAKTMHCVCLALAGIGMLAIPEIREKAFLFIPMIGIGLAWASIMGNPYIMLAGSIPKERVGVYMGIFNMFIVIPMMIQIFTLPLYYKTLLNSDPQNVIRLAGVLMLCAAVSVLFVKVDAAPAGK